MKPQVIVISIIAMILISLPLSIYAVGSVITSVAKAPGVGIHELISAASGLFASKTQATTTSTFVTITPISEIALARQTIKMTTVYKRQWLGSECVVIAEQNFAIKYGYNTSTIFKIMRNGGKIDVPEPLVLSVEPEQGAPTILYKVGGWYNGVNPDDVLELTNQMNAEVRGDQRIGEFRRFIKDTISNQLGALQKEIDNTTSPH